MIWHDVILRIFLVSQTNRNLLPTPLFCIVKPKASTSSGPQYIPPKEVGSWRLYHAAPESRTMKNRLSREYQYCYIAAVVHHAIQLWRVHWIIFVKQYQHNLIAWQTNRVWCKWYQCSKLGWCPSFAHSPKPQCWYKFHDPTPFEW